MLISKLKAFLRPIYIPIIERIKFFLLRKKYPVKILNSESTIDYILKSECSIARYGDGEFNIAFRKKGVNFQSYNEKISDRMREVLKSEDESLLVCLPYALSNQTGLKKHAKCFWRNWSLDNDNYLCLSEFIPREKVFGDASITRPYQDWKNAEHAAKIWPELKKLWENKDVLIVEGNQTRLGINNDLLDDAKSIKRILCPAENAFDSYEEILNCVTEIHNGETVLIALGPTATILAADLAKRGIRALDIGHVDIEYEWYLRKSVEKIRIPGKYTNEAGNNEQIEECTDAEYVKQIIKRINC